MTGDLENKSITNFKTNPLGDKTPLSTIKQSLFPVKDYGPENKWLTMNNSNQNK